MRMPGIATRHPLLVRVALFLLLPLGLVAAWLWVDLQRSLPETGVTLLQDGVSAATMLQRDAHGAVHIHATQDLDAYFAVGYAQAQDRLWQLQVQRWMVRGRLSEVFGRQSIDSDVWFRTLGLYESARTAWPALSPQAQASLTAYTRGVNAAITRTPSLPPEFRLLGVKPEPWSELDSLAWIKMFALSMGGNFRREIDRYVAGHALPAAQADVFFPGYPRYPQQTPTTARVRSTDGALTALAVRQQRLQEQLQMPHPGTGSNAWAVQGRLTSDGGALLANDPHLALQIPSLWYAINVRSPGLTVSGMSLIGLPVVVFGRNEAIAWAGTNMMADTQDLFLERSDAEGRRYQTPAGWTAFDVRVETIQVRADFPEELRRPYTGISLKVRRTGHGPVVSDYFDVFDSPVALRWTGLDDGDTSYEAFYRLGYAQDWTQFKRALEKHVAPALNMLYADRAGNIGYLAAGRIPIRSQGEGTAPAPGWDAGHAWKGYVPVEQWVQLYNPPAGYIVSANNRMVGVDYPYFISHDWASPARAMRIEQLLRQQVDAGRMLNPDDMKRIQADTLDLDAAALMDTLRQHLPRQGHAAVAAQYLQNWDGDMRGDSQAAALFHSWMRHFRQRLFRERLRGSWEVPQSTDIAVRLGEGVRSSQLNRLLQGDGEGWCDTGNDDALRSCARLLALSQEDALAELHKLRGDWSMRRWHWSTVQQTVYAHAPFSAMKPFNVVFERRVGNGGSSDTINVAASHFVEGEGYRQQFGAGFRQVIQMGPDTVVQDYMISTGQSGNPLSPHYADMVIPFHDGRYVPLDASLSAPESAAGSATAEVTP